MTHYESKRNRALSAGLCILIFVVLALYTWIVLEDARASRIRSTLDRNQATAAFSAQFISGERNDFLVTSQLLARQKTIETLVRKQDGDGAREWLESAHRYFPTALSLAVFMPNGMLLASDPRKVENENASQAEWYQAIGRENTGYKPYISWQRFTSASQTPVPNGAEGTILVALRLDESTPEGGFLLAALKPELIRLWVQELKAVESTIYLVDADHHLIAASQGAPPGLIENASNSIEAALTHRPGSLTLTQPGTGKIFLTGYAPTRFPRWVVLFTQSENAVLEPTYSLVQRFAVLLVPTMLLLLGAIALLDQISARQEKMTQQLAEQNAELQRVGQIRSNFLANVSHDLRTPLTSMSLALSGLLDTDAAWDLKEARCSIQFVSEEVDLLEAKVRNLLEMSRLDAKAQPREKIPADLTDLVGAAIERLEPVLGARSLVYRFPEDPLLAYCNPAQIEIVLLNLLENAVKYSPSNGPLCLIGEHRQDRVLFAVEDVGPGIESGQEERIFEKFYRAPNGMQSQGTGLGLAICKAIVEAHGGTIGATSIPEGGARFWFTLPAASTPAGLKVESAFAKS